jgi:hypothetical protein
MMFNVFPNIQHFVVPTAISSDCHIVRRNEKGQNPLQCNRARDPVPTVDSRG